MVPVGSGCGDWEVLEQPLILCGRVYLIYIYIYIPVRRVELKTTQTILMDHGNTIAIQLIPYTVCRTLYAVPSVRRTYIVL